MGEESSKHRAVKEEQCASMEPLDDMEEDDENEASWRSRFKWASSSDSTWEQYEDFYFDDKKWFARVDEWREVLKICHAYWNLAHRTRSAYTRREVDGIDAFIEVAKQLVSTASVTLPALKKHHALEEQFRAEHAERTMLEWKRKGYGRYDGWPHEPRNLYVGDHPGYKQLAITYERQGDLPLAIEMCQQAMDIGWPGDWDVRKARYERKLAAKQKPTRKKASVRPDQSIHKNQQQRFCIECGKYLQEKAKFCGYCGTPILGQ